MSVSTRPGAMELTRSCWAEFVGEDGEHLIQGLAEIKDWLLKQDNVAHEHIDLVDARFTYLESAVERMSRRDWLHTCIGVFFTIVVSVGLPPNQARGLFSFASQTLRTALSEIAKLLQ